MRADGPRSLIAELRQEIADRNNLLQEAGLLLDEASGLLDAAQTLAAARCSVRCLDLAERIGRLGERSRPSAVKTEVPQ